MNPPAEVSHTTDSAAGSRLFGRITIRSVVAGVLLSLVISVGFTYTRVVLGKGSMSADYITAGAICILFVLMALVNPCMKLVRRDWGFARDELVVIYIMLIIASTIPTWGFSGLFVGTLPGVYYFATPENNWAGVLHPLIKSWMVPQDPKAIKDFYEGLPAGGSVPWGAWLGPLSIWVSFIIAIYLMMIAAMVLVRRQWVEHERLAFPLVQLPMEMTETGHIGDRVSPFLKNPVMWAGFAVPFILLSARGLHQYFPVVPEPDFYSVALLFRETTGLVFNLSFTVIGFAYLLSLQVAVGFWFFHLVTKCFMGWQMMTGYRLQGDIERYMEGTLLVAFMTTGAMFVLVLFGVWTARGHLREVWRKVVTGKGVDDADEVLSYRAAVAILVLCGAYTTVWLHLSGLPMAITVAFLLVAFAIFIFMARLVAEGGLGFMMPPMPAQPLIVNFAGTSTVTQAGVFSLALSFTWAGYLRVLLMASVHQCDEDGTGGGRAAATPVLGHFACHHRQPGEFADVPHLGRLRVRRGQSRTFDLHLDSEKHLRVRSLQDRQPGFILDHTGHHLAAGPVDGNRRRTHGRADPAAPSLSVVAAASTRLRREREQYQQPGLVQHLHRLRHQSNRTQVRRGQTLRCHAAVLPGIDPGSDRVYRNVAHH